ncbi:glycosyltransferase family 4 protein [Desulfogranum marinum]|uniref:glycosyltransferase family 4 protein n=1 Tax=Desulfogranum marinum TaxID=453220 RepID=UPI0019630560|nr:glycosyltransferase family 4 protein [Desulfogranum marinum]MBM9514102.1 glycosyltransferase family 4 protein [Desulfogranum marinum]
MRIAFYAPFKPLDHPTPSGDQMIGRGIYASLCSQGHQVFIVSKLRCRWIYWNPSHILQALIEIKKIIHRLQKEPVDCWLTYHCYYKAPDIVGPTVTKKLGLPYIICQGSYATKFRRQFHTIPGFILNKKALLQADLHISDRYHNLVDLQRIVPPHRLTYVKPGLEPARFRFDRDSRHKMHTQWQTNKMPVILTAAMFRADVKSKGIAWVIECCGKLRKQGFSFQLVITGDGPQKQYLHQLARQHLADSVVFTGAFKHEQMYQVYSGGDIFAFPGFRESLGMVFLEAQSCGLPVVACDNGGIPEVVIHKKSGLLSPVTDKNAFTANIKTLLTNQQLRRQMGKYAAQRVRQHHDKEKNYGTMGSRIQDVVRQNHPHLASP